VKQNIRSNSKPSNRVMSRLAAEKKKTVMALCLIAVMAFMWLRVFIGKTPQSAEAAPLMVQGTNPNASASKSESKVSFIELPKIKGRNDALARDFFAADGWRDFMKGGEGKTGDREVNVSKDGDRELVKRIAEKLKLETIMSGGNPQAFINDKLLSVGDKLLVGDGANTYECEVVGIQENAVFIGCGEAKIELKLIQTSGISN